MNLKCDNRQTISLIIKEEPPFSTRLRHVDIHRHWLRQEAQEKRAQFAWVPITSMAADGLLLSHGGGGVNSTDGHVRMSPNPDPPRRTVELIFVVELFDIPMLQWC